MRAGDDADAGVRGEVVHLPEMPGDVVRGAPLIHIVDPGDDHDRHRCRVDHVSREARRNLIAALAVHPAIQHLPFGLRFHQPVGVLARLVAAPVRGRLERRLKPRSAGGRRVTERDDADFVQFAFS